MSEVTSLAEMTASQLTAAVAFNDSIYAGEITNSLEQHNSVARACVYLASSRIFAESNHGDCPAQEARLEEALNENKPVRASIEQNGLHLGSLYLYVNNGRVSQFSNRIIVLSLGILLGCVLLVIIPASSLVQRLISSPVNKLMKSTQTLLPSKQDDLQDPDAAVKIVESAKTQLLEIHRLNKLLGFKLGSIIHNYDFALSLMEKELHTHQTASEINELVSKTPTFKLSHATSLFALSRTELESSVKHIEMLHGMLVRQEQLLSEGPTAHALNDFFVEAFNEYYTCFHNNKVISSVSGSGSVKPAFISEALRSFIHSFFMLCDMYIKKEHPAEIRFSHHVAKNEKHINSSLCLFNSSMAIARPLEADAVSNDNFLFEEGLLCPDEIELFEKTKSIVEKMKFYARLISPIERDIELIFCNEEIKVNFVILSVE